MRHAAGHRTVTLAVAFLIVAVGRPPALGDEPALPTPPRQAEPWTPPRTSLPRFLLSATTTLFEQGLADPRGCEYRGIHLAVGSVWGGEAHEVFTSGWVLPPADGQETRHAIAWSGLVYPVTVVGGPADLAADVRAMAGDGREGRAGVVGDRPGAFRKYGITNEASSVSLATPQPIAVCLLLRLGRADLAEALWSAITGHATDPKAGVAGRGLDLKSYGVSYLTLAQGLAWSRFDRAICAHMRGDDRLALDDARALDAFERAVDARAQAMGFARQDRPARAGRPSSYFDFLDQLPELLADQERRARERANPPPAPRGEGAEARIAALIRDLDQVAARQWGQPGAVVLGESPIIRDLIAQGDAAVEPLLRDFRSEDRLTRSVGFHRDFFRNRVILRADQAAYTALTGILRATNFAPPAPGRLDGSADARRTRAEVADQIQAYWERNRAIPLVERWYRTLADDKAGGAAWLEAAGNIIQRENVRTIPGGGAFQVTETSPTAPGETPPFRGESLRNGHEPTVAALLARRVEAMLKSPEGQRFELLDPCRMARIFATWDAAAAVPTLRELTRVCRERYARPGNGRDWTNQNLAVSIAAFTLARDGAGDRAALGEYAEWVRTTSPDWLDHNVLAVLEPFYHRPDDPRLAAAAGWLFGDTRSPWVPLIGRTGSRPSSDVVQLIASPMIEVPAFRRMVLAALDDRSRIGTAEAGEGGGVSVKFAWGLGMSRGASPGIRDVPAAGTEAAVRICDLYAWQLATLEGAPAFHPCWPLSKRESSLSAMATFLKGRGAR